MEYIQVGNYLLLVGGYGYSATINNHTTFQNLTLVDIKGLASAIKTGDPINSYFTPDFRKLTPELK